MRYLQAVERAFRPKKSLIWAPERFWPNWWAPELRSGAFRPTLTPANIVGVYRVSCVLRCFGAPLRSFAVFSTTVNMCVEFSAPAVLHTASTPASVALLARV